jgi:receptor protein-tyrosine kinase
MSLIEEAAKRLRQLQDAGVPVTPGAAAPAPAAAQTRRGSAEPTIRPAHADATIRPPRAEPTIRPAQATPARPRALDLARLQAGGFITPTLRDSKLLHEFRVIKRPLVQHALGRTAMQAPNRNLIMVTSALPGEGKTFVATNLAMSIAMEVDCRVLLVDADVVSPSVPQVFGIEPAKGLMDVLTQPATGIGDVLMGTNVERLTLLLAGTPHSSASEFLASDAMTGLLAELSSRYPDRIVVFDSPPLLATTEARVLATHMGQVVLVVEAQRTAHAALESAMSTVESCPLVYTLVNKAPESKVGSYYGYGAYGYGR